MKKALSLILSLLMITGMLSAFPFNASAQECQHEWSEWEEDIEATCTSAGEESRYCYNCGLWQTASIPKTAHDWSSWETEEKATVFNDGEASRYCYNCWAEQYKLLPKKNMDKTEKKVVKRVKSYLQAAKKYNVKGMNKCFANKKTDYGYPTAKVDWIYKKYNKKIKWEFLNVTKVNKKKYRVKVSVTRPNFYKPAYNAMFSSLKWSIKKWGRAEKAEKHGKEIGLHCLDLYNKNVKKCKKKTATEDVTFVIVKKGGKWLIKDKNRTIVDIATAYENVALDDCVNDFAEYYAENYWYLY